MSNEWDVTERDLAAVTKNIVGLDRGWIFNAPVVR
jgi:hypothetical protein